MILTYNRGVNLNALVYAVPETYTRNTKEYKIHFRKHNNILMRIPIFPMCLKRLKTFLQNLKPLL